jgi:hypothetical protein
MRYGRLLATAAVVLLLFTGDAIAVTQSTLSVDAPTGTYVLDDQVTGNNMISLHGTSNGTTGDHVDIYCFAGTSMRKLVTGLAVQADGSFSYSGPLGAISDETCVLRALPGNNRTDYAPGMASPFVGPTLAIGSRSNTYDTTSPNAGKLEQYYIYRSQLRGGFDYRSLGNCAIHDGYVYDPVTFNSAIADYCNGYFWVGNGISDSTGYANPDRSELEVDGDSAYVAGAVANLGIPAASGYPGFPKLTYSYAPDPLTGDMILQETDQVVKCSPSPASYPPTASTCKGFVPAGIQVHLRIIQGQGGRTVTEVQSFSSTDGHTHAIDLLEDNEFFHPKQDGELDFPWTAKGMSPYTTVGQQLRGPSRAGPGSFFFRGSASEPDGGENAAVGATTFSSAPSSETIVGATNASQNYSWVDLRYQRTVPAQGATQLAFAYANAFKASEVQATAKAAEPMFVPSVSISSPKDRSTIKSGVVTVFGTAHDDYGMTSVRVNGRQAKLNPILGTWRVRLKLPPGSNPLSVIATNVFGNTASAHITLSFPLTLADFRQSRRRWKHRAGTMFSFALDAPARVTFNFTRKGQPAGRLSFNAGAGRDGRLFNGALPAGEQLKPGRYSVTVSAKAGRAKTKTSKTLRFTITG